jgi:hypothetical protein
MVAVLQLSGLSPTSGLGLPLNLAPQLLSEITGRKSEIEMRLKKTQRHPPKQLFNFMSSNGALLCFAEVGSDV